ncbi:MAG: lipid A biosynthesis acyltransferase, partial [Planctomycetales bacterium]|nr:lipid A biosynthesis acyltransferase [Planctomycetales bacterium]
MKSAADFLVYLAVRLAIATVQALPLETCQRLAGPLAYLANDLLRIRRLVLQENLRLAFPQLDLAPRHLLARRQWQHLVLMIVEIAHAQRKIHLTNWRRHVR